MPNIIDLITEDHRRVEELFARFRADQAGAVASTIFTELTMHAEAEEHVLYPALTGLGDGAGASEMERSYVDHSKLKTLITRARQTEGVALVQLMEGIEAEVAAHVAHEESIVLPLLEGSVTGDALDVLGAQMEQLKQRVG